VTPVTAGQRPGETILPLPPTNQEKESYAWRSLPYLATAIAISAAFMIVAQLLFEIRNPIALPFLLFTLVYAVYQGVSIPVNFTGRSFDLQAH
jgi:cellulose synthase (UDP-forming)